MENENQNQYFQKYIGNLINFDVKSAYYESRKIIIKSNSFNVENIGNLDINLIKFIIVQCLNYYKSEEENNENLKKFF